MARERVEYFVFSHMGYSFSKARKRKPPLTYKTLEAAIVAAQEYLGKIYTTDGVEQHIDGDTIEIKKMSKDGHHLIVYEVVKIKKKKVKTWQK